MNVNLDTLCLIFRHLDPKSLASCMAVCKFWKNALGSSVIWSSVIVLDPRAFLKNKVKHLKLTKSSILPVRNNLSSLLLNSCSCPIQSITQTCISSKSTLSRLSLSNSKINDVSLLRILSTCRNLLSLDISSTPIEFNFSINKTIKLQTLIATNCSYISTKNMIQFLSKASDLKTLNLNSCSSLDLEKILSFNLNSLENIDLSNLDSSIQFTNKISSVTSDFVSNSTNVKHFALHTNMGSNNPFDDTLLTLMAACWTNLVHLDLRFNLNISRQGLENIAVGCVELKTLLLGSCVLIDDDTVTILIRFCKGLTRLDVSGTRVSDVALIAISKYGKKCMELSLANCGNITATGLSKLLQKNGVALGYLNLSGCTQISHECIDQIRRVSPKLKLEAKLQVLGSRIV